MALLALRDRDIVLMRDQASGDYVEGGGDADPSTAYLRLVEGALTTLQPTLYFQVIASAINSYWYIKSSSGQFLRVETIEGPNLDRVKWSPLDPSTETIVDKSPYLFQFIHIPGSESPAVYTIATYYNSQMILSQPAGPGTALVMAAPQAVRGNAPELAFEVAVTGEAAIPRAIINGVPVGMGGAADTQSIGSVTDTTNTSLSTGAIVMITLFSVLAFCIILFLGTMLWSRWIKPKLAPAVPVPVGLQAPVYVGPSPVYPAAAANYGYAGAPGYGQAYGAYAGPTPLNAAAPVTVETEEGPVEAMAVAPAVVAVAPVPAVIAVAPGPLPAAVVAVPAPAVVAVPEPAIVAVPETAAPAANIPPLAQEAGGMIGGGYYDGLSMSRAARAEAEAAAHAAARANAAEAHARRIAQQRETARRFLATASQGPVWARPPSSRDYY
jgi:hypothetical protein